MVSTQLVESNSPAAVADPQQWEAIDLADGPGWLWQPDGGGEVHIHLDRHGTSVGIRGLHDRAESIAFADRLQPVMPEQTLN